VKFHLLTAVNAVKSGRSIPEVGRTYKISESRVWLHMTAGIISNGRLGCEVTFTADQE
jgi:hypothetical protein